MPYDKPHALAKDGVSSTQLHQPAGSRVAGGNLGPLSESSSVRVTQLCNAHTRTLLTPARLHPGAHSPSPLMAGMEG